MISTICILIALFNLFCIVGSTGILEKKPVEGCLGIIFHTLVLIGIITILVMVN